MKNVGISTKEEYWQNHITCWKQSDQTQKDYCRAHDLAVATFSYWKRKLTQTNGGQSHFFPLAVISERQTEATVPPGQLQLTLQGQRFQIGVVDGFSTETLKKLIITLEQL